MVNIEQYMAKQWITKEDVQQQKEWVYVGAELDTDGKPILTLMFNGVKKKFTIAKDVAFDLDQVFEGFAKQTDVAFGKIIVLSIYKEINKKTNSIIDRIKVDKEATIQRNKILRRDML